MIEGVADPINFGMNACAGLPPEQMHGWTRFDEIRRGGYDPAARLDEMDRDGVDAEVLYPTPAARAGGRSPTPTPSSTSRSCSAYNDWLSEYVAYAPDRFGGLALLPEPRRRGRGRRDRSACRTARHPRRGDGLLPERHPRASSREDDAVLGTLAEAGIPLSIHVSLTQAMPAGAPRRRCPATAASSTRRTASSR